MIDNNHNKIKYSKTSRSILDFCVLIDKEHGVDYIAAGLYINKKYKILIPFRNGECLHAHIADLITNEKLKII